VPASGAAARSVAARRSGGGGPGHAASAGQRDRQTSAARARKRDRALRRDVLRLQGCLASVPRAERRVLVLRAGVGGPRPRSRARVARITHLRRARVALLERRGLRRLRALGRSGGCAVSTAGTKATVGALPVGGSSQGAGPAPRGQVLAEHSSGSAKPSKSSGEGSKQSVELPIAAPQSGPGGGSLDLTLVIIPLALAILGFVLVREVRRTP
jgi:hypothetical protein